MIKCHRTACRAPDARWFNKSTRRFYCEPCASTINKLNAVDSLRIYGIDKLCWPCRHNFLHSLDATHNICGTCGVHEAHVGGDDFEYFERDDCPRCNP